MATPNTGSTDSGMVDSMTFRMALTGMPLVELLKIGDILVRDVLPNIDTGNVNYLDQVQAMAQLIQLVREERDSRKLKDDGPKVISVNGVPVDTRNQEAVRARIAEVREEQTS
tara:strand:- start:1640 stop:1978 length:339 start_codon:yes stop_codon:yes gene_type:complete